MLSARPSVRRPYSAGFGESGWGGVGGEAVAEVGQGVGEEAGDVHLGDAELVADVGLGHVAVEAQQQDVLLAAGEFAPVGGDGVHVEGVLDVGVVLAEDVGEGGGVGAPGEGGVERGGLEDEVGAAGFA